MSAYACSPHAGSELGIGWNWVTHVAARGLDVTVLTTEENRGRIEAELRQRPVPNLAFHHVEMPVSRLREATGMHYLVWQWMALRAARRLAAGRPFDVAHHVSYGSVHVPTQLWRLGIPVVFGPVGGAQTAPPSMLPYFGQAARNERIRTLFTALVRQSPLHRRWLRKMAAILVANTATAAMVKALGRNDAQLMFDTGVSDRAFAREPRRFHPSSAPLRVLWVGRMMPRKAIGLTLDIFARVRAPATLTIVGDGLPPERVREMITERGLDGRVFWAGHRLPWDEVHHAYLAHDLMLFNSLRESGGSQLIEAMALGLPIVTLNLHGPGDLVPGSAGIKVNVVSPEQVTADMAAAIDRYAALPAEERSAMSEAGWRFTHGLTHELRALQDEQLYRRLLGLPPTTAPVS